MKVKTETWNAKKIIINDGSFDYASIEEQTEVIERSSDGCSPDKQSPAETDDNKLIEIIRKVHKVGFGNSGFTARILLVRKGDQT